MICEPTLDPLELQNLRGQRRVRAIAVPFLTLQALRNAARTVYAAVRARMRRLRDVQIAAARAVRNSIGVGRHSILAVFGRLRRREPQIRQVKVEVKVEV